MEGRRVKWILGTDHAGIGTQAVVEKELAKQGSSRHDLGREEFVERVWEWRERVRRDDRRAVQAPRRLAATTSDERFTLDEGYVKAVYRVFVQLYEKGYIYRDNYMVNWDPGLALGDLATSRSRTATSPTRSTRSTTRSRAAIGVLTVATVRPETMLADTAVAVHPDDERYRDLVGGICELPLVGRRLPIIADEHVDPEFGTGALKITPGPRPQRLRDRPQARARGDLGDRRGRPDDRAGAGERFVGHDAPPRPSRPSSPSCARQGLISAEEPYTHSVPFSHRSGERIEPLISLQWFCAMDELAKPAIEVVRDGRVRFTPERWTQGLPRLDGGHPALVRLAASSGGATSSRSGTATPARRRSSPRPSPSGCPTCEGELRRDEDVLDTWFSSALWPFATLGWPEDTPECGPSTRPTCSRPRATSSTSGSRG